MTIAVESITTKYGTAKIHNGYWTITTRKEGNHRKRLHRLIYEDYYSLSLSSDDAIHHKDGNKLNNQIDNLERMSISEHITHHNMGNQYFLGKKMSKEHKAKISQAKKGHEVTEETKQKISKTRILNSISKGKNNPRCRWNEIDIAGGLELLKWYKYTLKVSQNKVAKLHNMSVQTIVNYLKDKDLSWSVL